MLFEPARSCLEWPTCGVSARRRSGHTVMQGDSKRIIRQWDREIEDEIRRETARTGAGGPWRAVVWGALWVLWLGLLAALIAHTKALG
jgi:hypothetical protein